MTTRRDFLKGLSALAAAAGIAPAIRAEPAPVVPPEPIVPPEPEALASAPMPPYLDVVWSTDQPDLIDIDPATGAMTTRAVDLPPGTYHATVRASSVTAAPVTAPVTFWITGR
jgi:hypothetical protein